MKIFCQAGKTIEAALHNVGAVSFYERGDADDSICLEDIVDPWIEGLYDALRNIVKPGCPCEAEARITEKDHDFAAKVLNSLARQGRTNISDEDTNFMFFGFEKHELPSVLRACSRTVLLKGVDYSPKLSVNQFYDESKARVTSVSGARKLTAAGALKTVWHIEVTAEQEVGFNKSYRAGDAFGMLVENDANEVSALLSYLNVDGSDTIQMQNLDGSEIVTETVRKLLSERVDIRSVPNKTFLLALSQYCNDPSESKYLLRLCSKSGRELYSEQVSQRSLSLLQLLQDSVPSCRPPIVLLLDQLPPLAPRWYSATSSPDLDGERNLHLSFSVVPGGLASTALAARCAQFQDGERVAPVVLIPRASDADGHFHPPPSLATSYVMVGPGTGVAPFRGFLRERAAQLFGEPRVDAGDTYLFFGCRDPDLDFLYREELEGQRDRGVLKVLDVAFSRVGPTKVHVQDRIRERKEEVAKILMEGGSLFVCGDGGGMAAGVDEAVREILAEKMFEGDMELGKAELKKMAEEHRYVRDIWFRG